MSSAASFRQWQIARDLFDHSRALNLQTLGWNEEQLFWRCVNSDWLCGHQLPRIDAVLRGAAINAYQRAQRWESAVNELWLLQRQSRAACKMWGSAGAGSFQAVLKWSMLSWTSVCRPEQWMFDELLQCRHRWKPSFISGPRATRHGRSAWMEFTLAQHMKEPCMILVPRVN